MKKILGGLLAVLLLFIAASVGTHFLFDQGAIRQQVVKAIRQQSGLELNMSGASFQLLPWPSFHAEEISLARPQCRPFLTARSAHGDISFLALFHREIALRDFTIEGGWVSFRHNRGEGTHCSSWFPPSFARERQPFSEEGSKASSVSDHTPWHVSFESLALQETQFEWKRGDTQSYPLQGKISINHLTLKGLKSESPRLDLEAARGETPVFLEGRLGPVQDIFKSFPHPWAFSLGLSLGEDRKSNQLTFDGVIGGGKATVNLQGHSNALRDWNAVFPRAVLPDMRNLDGKISFRAEEGQAGSLFSIMGRGVTPVSLSLHIGNFAMSDSVGQTISLEDVKMLAEGASPLLQTEGMLKTGPSSWHFMANLGALAQLTALWGGDTTVALPLDVQIEQAKIPAKAGEPADVQFQAQGQVGLQGSHITLKGNGTSARLPVLPFLPVFWNKMLSGGQLHDFSLQTVLSVGALSEQKRPDSLSFDDFQLKSQSLNGEGTLAFSRLTHSVPRFDAHLHFDRLDGASLFADNNFSESEKGKAIPRQNSHSFPERLAAFSKTWDGLADLKFDQLTLGDLTYHDLSFYALMGDGKLTIDPLSAQVDDIPLKARLTLDQSRDESHLKFASESFLVPVPLLLKSTQQPEFLEGKLQLDGQLSADFDPKGDSFLSALRGAMGFSLTQGRVQKSFLAPLAGPAASFMKLGKPTMKLRCVAGKLNFHNGQADLSTLALQTRHYMVEGKGRIDLTNQTLDLLLKPHIELADRELSTPLQMTGPWHAPRITPARNDEGYFQMNIGGASPDACASAVQEARSGHPGPSLEAAEAHSGKMEKKVGGILKSLWIGGKF